MESMAQRKVSVTLPDFLVEETDRLASSLNRSRSEIVALAVKRYIDETKKIELKEQNNMHTFEIIKAFYLPFKAYKGFILVTFLFFILFTC